MLGRAGAVRQAGGVTRDGAPLAQAGGVLNPEIRKLLLNVCLTIQMYTRTSCTR
jgi:hypothetical protein